MTNRLVGASRAERQCQETHVGRRESAIAYTTDRKLPRASTVADDKTIDAHLDQIVASGAQNPAPA